MRVATRTILTCVACFAAGYAIPVAVLSPVEDRLESNPEPAGLVREFVCEDDGGLTERHVGVAKASLLQPSAIWAITYEEGDVAYYHQPSGETCKTEEYVAPAVVDDADKLLALKWGNGHG